MPTYPSEHALPKSIAVFGAGPGLGQAVARHYAREGYAVTLVGRRSEPLDRLAKDLTSAGATAHVITADLSDTGATPRLAEQIRAKAGHLDAFYYAPTPDTGFVSAANLTPQHAQKFMPLIFYTMLALVQEFLPHMLEQGDGAILTAQGGSTVHGLPNMSGPSPAQAAQRNYLQAPHAEVAEKGVYVGHRWNIGVVKAAAMEHWCRCGPGRGGAAEVCGVAGVCGASQARGGEPGGAMMHLRSRAWWHPDPGRGGRGRTYPMWGARSPQENARMFSGGMKDAGRLAGRLRQALWPDPAGPATLAHQLQHSLCPRSGLDEKRV